MSIVLTMPETIDQYEAPVIDSATAEAAAEVAELLESGEGDESLGVDEGEQEEILQAASFIEKTEAIEQPTTESPSLAADPSTDPLVDPQPDPYTDWQINLQAAQDAHTEAAVECRKIEDQLKDARKLVKETLDRYIRIRDAGPQHPLSGSQGGESSPVASYDGPASPLPTVDTTPLSPDAWKSDSIASLQLKPALMDRLVEHGIATVGHLEALREKIANHQEKWPKGIGTAKVTEIEKAMDIFWDRWRERSTPHKPMPQLEGVMSTTTPAGIAKHDPDVERPSAKQVAQSIARAVFGEGVLGNPDPPVSAEDSFLAHLEQLSALPIERIKELHDMKFDAFENGALGRKQGEAASQCPTMYRGDSRDAWLLGWLQVDLAKTGKALTEEQRAEPGSKATPAITTAPSAVLVDDLDLL